MNKLYTLEDVAKITQQSMSTMYRHLKEGLLEANKIGSTWRITQEQLDKYLKGED